MKMKAHRTYGRTRAVPAILAVLAAASCTDGPVGPPDGPDPDPDQKAEAELLFLRLAPGAALLTTDTSFVATAGEDLRVEIFFAPPAGSGEDKGERFLRFDLEETSLLRYPPGHPKAGALFQAGDTVTIRIMLEENELIGTFEPSGLQFNADDPAELELRYSDADDDYDGDGDSEPEREVEIDLWRQESAGDPWVRVGEVKNEELDKIEANLTSFSRYALAI